MFSLFSSSVPGRSFLTFSSVTFESLLSVLRHLDTILLSCVLILYFSLPVFLHFLESFAIFISSSFNMIFGTRLEYLKS